MINQSLLALKLPLDMKRKGIPMIASKIVWRMVWLGKMSQTFFLNSAINYKY